MRLIEEIKADMKKLCNYTDTCKLTAELILALASEIPLDRLAEICKAERENKLVVLPCAAGDKIYYISSAKLVCEAIVTNDPVWFEAKIILSGTSSLDQSFCAGEMGKEWYLTEAEAKAALGGAGDE